MNVYKHTLNRIFIFFFFTKTCIWKSLKSVSPLKWTHERRKNNFVNWISYFAYIYSVLRQHTTWSPESTSHVVPRTAILIWSPQMPAHVVPRTTILMWSPQLPSYMVLRTVILIWSPQLPSNVVPRTAILMWSPQLPSHVVPRNAILMWSPQLPSHVVPTTDITCGPQKWSAPSPSHHNYCR